MKKTSTIANEKIIEEKIALLEPIIETLKKELDYLVELGCSVRLSYDTPTKGSKSYLGFYIANQSTYMYENK